MKWVVLASFIVCLGTLSKGSALRSTSESEDAALSIYTARRELKKLPAGVECLPLSSWKSKCNGCTCSADGHPACTDMACPGQEDEPELTCAPDTVWKNECNTCTCSPEGNAMCTRMGCGLFTMNDFNPVSDEHREDVSEVDRNSYLDDHNLVKRSPVCKPNALLKADCHFCKCAVDGQSYACTLNVCKEDDISDDVEVFKQPEDDDDEDQVNMKVCKPRGTFYIGCNTCHCNIDGTNFTCTNKPCPLPDDVELFHELREIKPIVLRSSLSNTTVVCAANRMFFKDCNTCWCNEDGTSYFCTRKVCVNELPDEVDEEKPANLQEIKRKCRPDEVFELDCNMCRCSQDGMSFSCTRKACMPEEKGKNFSLNRRTRATPQGMPKTCQPGQEFRMDCNKCLCNDEGQDYSCTRIDCSALNSNGNTGARTKRESSKRVKTECQPGSEFIQDCKENTNENDKNLPESVPSFRCNPGEQFKRDCNDCTCSADGKSVFCTLRLCDQELTPAI